MILLSIYGNLICVILMVVNYIIDVITHTTVNKLVNLSRLFIPNFNKMTANFCLSACVVVFIVFNDLR